MGKYSHILAIRVCAAGKGMVYKSFTLVWGHKFAKFTLIKGRTVVNTAAHPHPNYMLLRRRG